MNFTLLVLGSGAALPTYSRHCSGQVLAIGGTRMLIDCAESTQNHLRQYHQRIQSIDTIFISHLHGDHSFGLPGLLSTMHLCGRTNPLTVYGPVGIERMIRTVFEVSGNNIRYDLRFEELDFDDCREIFVSPHCRVSAFPLRHSVPTYGFRFEERIDLLNLRRGARQEYNLTDADCVSLKHGNDLVMADGTVVPNSQLTLPRRTPRSYAYCCDTACFEELVPLVAGVDLLCLESTFDNSFAAIAEERQHSTAAQAAALAAQAGVRQLMLTHFSARYRETDPLLDEARAIFPDTIPATDGLTLEIEHREDPIANS